MALAAPTTGRVAYLDWFERGFIQAHPNDRFVFGDNAERWGRGGQAAACRDEPNAIGVATLWAPGRFYIAGDARALEVVTQDLAKVACAVANGDTIYAPRDGLGTGLAQLPVRAPAISNFITAFFRALPGEACPWGNA